jgi:hypothetical protein
MAGYARTHTPNPNAQPTRAHTDETGENAVNLAFGTSKMLVALHGNRSDVLE